MQFFGQLGGGEGGDKQSIMGDSEIDNNLKIW